MNWDHEFCISDAFRVLIILASNVLIIGLVLAGLSTAQLYNCWQLARFLQWRFNFCNMLLVIRKQLCSNRLESLQGWIIQVVKIPNKSCLPAGELIYKAPPKKTKKPKKTWRAIASTGFFGFFCFFWRGLPNQMQKRGDRGMWGKSIKIWGNFKWS